MIATLPEGLLSRLGVRRGLVVARKVDDVDRAWIAALSPAVSPALERWLRETAVSLDRHEPKWRDPTAFTELCIPRRSDDEVAALIEHHYGAALALARVVLGAGEEQQ